MNLWLDDLRPAPDGWLWARNIADAQRLAEQHAGQITLASLDHDLGVVDRDRYLQAVRAQAAIPDSVFDPGAPTGYDFLLWLAEQREAHNRDLWPTEQIVVHSMNVRARAMCGLVDRYGRYPQPCRWQPAPEFTI